MNCNLQNTISVSAPRFSIDWLHGHTFGRDVENLFSELEKIDSRLGFANFKEWSTGIYNYSTRYCLNDSGIFTIAFNKALDDEEIPEVCNPDLYATDIGYNRGIFVSISGDGFRYMGNDTAKKVFDLLSSYGFCASRFDIACDLFDKDNAIVPLLFEAFKTCLKPKEKLEQFDISIKSNMVKSMETVKFYYFLDNLRDWNNESWNVTFGKKSSTCGMFRMYDKWLEIKTGRHAKISDEYLKACPSDYWYRLECEMHYNNANCLFKAFVSGEIDIRTLWCSSCSRLFDVIEFARSNVYFETSKADSVPVWVDFCSINTDSHIFIQQIVILPYVYDDARKEQNIRRNCKYIFDCLQRMVYNPDLFTYVNTEGNRRHSEDLRYSDFRRQHNIVLPDIVAS